MRPAIPRPGRFKRLAALPALCTCRLIVYTLAHTVWGPNFGPNSVEFYKIFLDIIESTSFSPERVSVITTIVEIRMENQVEHGATRPIRINVGNIANVHPATT